MRIPADQSASGTILVVDDQALNRELIQDILVNNGFKVVVASDGNAALLAMEQSQIDLVLLDVVMQIESGFEVCREIKRNPLSCLTPVVFVTALSDPASRLKGIHAGADALMTIPFDPDELIARVRSLLFIKQKTDELESVESVLFTLARIVEGRDPSTHGHCERISSVSARLGKYLGLDSEQVSALRLAGVVHDIGKINIPDAVLLKPGPLTSVEWSLMRQHPDMGERICAPLKSFRLALPIIRHHHEKQDGSGYPDGLRGSAIPLTACVLQVVDIFDALTSVRPYKAAMSHAEAIRTMKVEVGRGWWNPRIFEAFEQFLLEGNRDYHHQHDSECSAA